jgi:hypothetical protein
MQYRFPWQEHSKKKVMTWPASAVTEANVKTPLDLGIALKGSDVYEMEGISAGGLSFQKVPVQVTTAEEVFNSHAVYIIYTVTALAGLNSAFMFLLDLQEEGG